MSAPERVFVNVYGDPEGRGFFGAHGTEEDAKKNAHSMHATEVATAVEYVRADLVHVPADDESFRAGQHAACMNLARLIKESACEEPARILGRLEGVLALSLKANKVPENRQLPAASADGV